MDKTAVLILSRPLATNDRMKELYPMLDYELAAGKTYQLTLTWGIWDNENSGDGNQARGPLWKKAEDGPIF